MGKCVWWWCFCYRVAAYGNVTHINASHRDNNKPLEQPNCVHSYNSQSTEAQTHTHRNSILKRATLMFRSESRMSTRWSVNIWRSNGAEWERKKSGTSERVATVISQGLRRNKHFPFIQANRVHAYMSRHAAKHDGSNAVWEIVIMFFVLCSHRLHARHTRCTIGIAARQVAFRFQYYS